MKHMLKTIAKTVKSVKGNSLAEFATTTALMATLAATAAPKLSEMSEGAKGEKSRNEIDKIVKQAGSFYQDIADLEGRGRFPNQTKFNVAIGGPNGNPNYSNQGANGTYDLAADIAASDAHTTAIVSDLRPGAETQADRTAGWDRFDETHSNVWQLVFAAGDNALGHEPQVQEDQRHLLAGELHQEPDPAPAVRPALSEAEHAEEDHHQRR